MPYQFRRKAQPGEKRDAILAEVTNPERIRKNPNFLKKDSYQYFMCKVDLKGNMIAGSEEKLYNEENLNKKSNI